MSSISSEPSVLADVTSNENACTHPHIFQTFDNNFVDKSSVMPWPLSAKLNIGKQKILTLSMLNFSVSLSRKFMLYLRIKTIKFKMSIHFHFIITDNVICMYIYICIYRSNLYLLLLNGFSKQYIVKKMVINNKLQHLMKFEKSFFE